MTIKKVATISANSDRSIGKLLAESMAKVGKEGVITVVDGKSLENEVDIIEGMKFDNGTLSRYFFTDMKNQQTVFEDPLILITDKKISNIHDLIPLLEKVAKERKKLLIIAENVEGDVLSTLIINKARGLDVCAVKAPGFGEQRTASLQDIAVLTGGTLIAEDTGLKLEDVELTDLGKAKKITVTASDTLILDGGGAKTEITERCDIIREAIGKTTSEYEGDKLKQRLAKLSGGVAVIKVGGASEVEVQERKDRIIDALSATRAAVSHGGIVPGGGSALLFASKNLEELKVSTKSANFDQGQGVQIVQDALKIPCKTIAKNAGIEGAVVVDKILATGNYQMGFDAQNDRYVNMIEAGIIDPTKVVRTALIDAASIASLMTTTEVIICDAPSKGEPTPGMPGGMGGMGGMF